MDRLQRITFRFGAETEVRYLPRVPEHRDFVTHGRHLWVVALVSADAVGVMVICELNGDGGRHLLRVA